MTDALLACVAVVSLYLFVLVFVRWPVIKKRVAHELAIRRWRRQRSEVERHFFPGNRR